MSNHLLRLYEEFIEEISPDELNGNIPANDAVQELSEFLEEQAEIAGDEDEPQIIAETELQLQKIWSLISRGEKCKNPSITKRFNELQEHLQFLYEESCPPEDDAWEDESWSDDGEEIFEDDYFDEPCEELQDEEE